MRSSFWPARKWKDYADLNVQAEKWCAGEAAERRFVQNEKLTVREAFEQERATMHEQVNAAYPVYDRKEVSVGKTPYIHFDCNLYTIPAEYVKRTLSVFATLTEVRICDGTKTVALHQRTFDKNQQVEEQAHIKDLVDAKRAARQHRNLDRLQMAAPSCTAFFMEAAKRGQNLGRMTQELNVLLDLYGSQELEKGVKTALDAGRTHAAAVKHAIEHERGMLGLEREPVRLRFESNTLANELTIRQNSLDGYGQLFGKAESENE